MPWHNKNTYGFERTSTEAEDNAKMAYDILSSRGWTLNAFCGFWGNVEAESGYNPWRWENEQILASYQTDIIATSTIHGYGLGQFTPCGKYINYAHGFEGYGPNFSDKRGSENDGSAQVIFIDERADYISTSSYPLSYADYKKAEYNLEYMAKAWFYNYERGTWSNNRVTAAEYWYDKLKDYKPSPPPTPPVDKKKDKMPIWLYPSVGRTMGFYQFTNVPILRKGDRGSLVRTIQTLLFCFGFFGEGLSFSEVVDSDFGIKTEIAVKAFQKEFDLTVDGIVGKQTFSKLGGI